MLTRKLLRDLWRDRWQYLAVAGMVVLGVMFFDASYMAYKNLDASYAYSYGRLKFEHFGIAFNAAPEQVADRVRRIPGVTAVEGRLIEDVAVELPGSTAALARKQLVGRLISVPATRRPAINDLQIVQGRYLSSRTAREVLLEASFAGYHHLRPGDAVYAVRGASRVRFRVAGVIRSPEYLFVVRSKQDILPFPETFGVMFVSADVLAPLVGKTGLINDLRVTVADPARRDAIMRETHRILGPYRPEDPVRREDQPSFQLLEQDLEGFQTYAVLFPALFLSVAGLTTYTLLTRMVHAQRAIIGALRAMGYSRGRVVVHFLSVAAVLGAAASTLGSFLGHALAGTTTRWYTSFLQAPFVLIRPWWPTMVGGFMIGTGICVAAAVFPARAAAGVRPAEALRGGRAASDRVVRIDRIVPGLERLPMLWRIPLRNLFRQRRRALSTLFGIVAAIGLIIVAQGLLDSTDAVMELFIGDVFKDDVRVEFLSFQDRSVVHRVRSWPGVVWAEGTVELAVEFRKGTRAFSGLLVGLEPETRLQQLQTEDGTPVALAKDGVLVGQVIRAKLGVEAGDQVEISLPRRRVSDRVTAHAARVAGFVWQPIGTIAYAPAESARQLFRQDLGLPPGAITGIRVKADPRHLQEIKGRLLDLSGAAAVQVLPEIRRMFEELMALSRRVITVMLAFGVALAFSITFNTITINVLERTNEFATMRTLGVSRARIFALITIENALTALVGIALGLPFGRALVIGFVRAAQTEAQMEMFTMQAVIRPATYALAAAAVLGVMLLSQIPGMVQISRLNLARATKERAT